MAELLVGARLRIKPAYAKVMGAEPETTATVIDIDPNFVTIKVDGYAASDSYSHAELFENWESMNA